MGVVAKFLIPQDTHMVKHKTVPRTVENRHWIKHMGLGFLSQALMSR